MSSFSKMITKLFYQTDAHLKELHNWYSMWK